MGTADPKVKIKGDDKRNSSARRTTSQEEGRHPLRARGVSTLVRSPKKGTQLVKTIQDVGEGTKRKPKTTKSSYSLSFALESE